MLCLKTSEKWMLSIIPPPLCQINPPYKGKQLSALLPIRPGRIHNDVLLVVRKGHLLTLSLNHGVNIPPNGAHQPAIDFGVLEEVPSLFVKCPHHSWHEKIGRVIVPLHHIHHNTFICFAHKQLPNFGRILPPLERFSQLLATEQVLAGVNTPPSNVDEVFCIGYGIVDITPKPGWGVDFGVVVHSPILDNRGRPIVVGVHVQFNIVADSFLEINPRHFHRFRKHARGNELNRELQSPVVFLAIKENSLVQSNSFQIIWS
mmetsp:Transcript_35663/g.66017  ORF Transcript_35663/g.66017 Transcript_35663/m.66017 type:complete len:260 (-) Transcript_35663:628-1407(-)